MFHQCHSHIYAVHIPCELGILPYFKQNKNYLYWETWCDWQNGFIFWFSMKKKTKKTKHVPIIQQYLVRNLCYLWILFVQLENIRTGKSSALVASHMTIFLYHLSDHPCKKVSIYFCIFFFNWCILTSSVIYTQVLR